MTEFVKEISMKELGKGIFNIAIAGFLGMTTLYIRDMKTDLRAATISIAGLNTKVAVVIQDTQTTKSVVKDNAAATRRNREDILVIKEYLAR